MSEGIWIGGHYTDDEERQQIEQEYRSRQNGGQVYQQDQGQVPAYDQGAYYAGQMQAAEPTVQEQAAAMPEQPAEPQPSTAWMANPANFAEVWQKFDQDPNLQNDDHYSREQVETLYDYYTYKNPGKTMDQWQPLMDNDEFVTKEILRNNWYDPAKEAAAEQAAQNAVAEIYNPTDPTKQEFFKQQELGDWDSLDWIGKLSTALTMNDEGVANMPSWIKKPQAAAKALSSAMAGPAALKIGAGILSMVGAGGAAAAIANPIVLGAVALATGGLAFYQAYTGKEIPVFGKFLELSDLADTVTEHALGFGSQAIDIGRQNIAQANEDPNDSYGLMQAVDQTLKDIGQHAGAMWDTGEYFYEMHGSVGDFAIDALKEIFKGEEGTKEGEAWFFNRGINEKQQLAEGTYGSEGERNIREMIEEMDAAGIDKDLRNSLIQQAVINVSGTSGNVSDYVAQMMLDLDIIATPLQNEGAGLISRITGDENGIRATEMGRKTGVLSDAPFVGQIYNALTGNSPTSGIMEWMDNRRTLARSTDVSQLTAADRFFGGINADGTIKEFARTERTGLTDMLPESKVAGVGNIANNVMNAYLYDVKDTADLRNRLASMRGDADAATEYQSGLNNSADVLTVREGIRHAMAESDPEVFIRQFEESEGARRTLQQAASDLGMEVKDMLSLVSETPEVFEQRVRKYAAQHDGMFAGMNVSESVDPVMTVVKGFTTSKDGKGAPLAWDIRQLQYQITTSLIDSMAKYYTEYYGVKPNSTLNTVFDTMKSAQSLLLLGWSPSYFINNVINNAVTSAAEGVLGFMTPKQINQWMTAFGVKPARMDADINAEFRGQTSQGSGGLEAFNKAASDAKKAGDDRLAGRALRELNEVLRRTNDKLGIFSKLSGQMEQLQGNQLTTVAIQQYWGKRWKRGEGFHLMPDSLVETIERQTPGMTDVIYTAIENGLNMEQIGKTLYGTYVMADPRVVMKSVCDNLFRGEASVYEEILEKSGVMNELEERITNCKTAEEREAVLSDVRDRLEKYIDNLKREDLIQRANDVAATVEAEGLAPVSQIMSEMEMNHVDFWIRQRNDWTEAYNRIRNEGMDSPQARALLTDLVSRQQKEWADLAKQEATTAAGIMKGLGFQNQSHAKYIGLMNEKAQNWQAFNEAKSRELNRAYERTSEIRKAAGRGKVDRVKIQEVWDEFHRNVSELYDQLFEKEREYQAKMDAAFVEGYEYSTGKSGEQLRNNFDRIRDIRKQMHDMQQDAHEKTRNMTPDEKAQFYEEFNPKYNALIREIGNLGDANAKIIDDAAESGTPTYEDHNPVTMTAEETVRATEVKDTADAVREKAMRERKGYLDREGIRQGFIDSGRTPYEADLLMTVVDARAKQWAKENGAYEDEFYSQAARLKGIASWIAGGPTAELFDAAGKRYAVDTVRPADINTDNFRSWFGNGYFKDQSGQPLVVYHGTAESFEVFNKKKADDKLGRSMGLGLGKGKFYLTTDPAAGKAFAESAVSMGRGKEAKVMELYTSVQNPILQSDYEARLEQKYAEYPNSKPHEPGYDSKARDRAISALDKEIRAEGYDAIYDPESGQIAVFDETQIKSIYNGGGWSRYDPNILHQTTAEYMAKYGEIVKQHYGTPEFREWFGDSKVVDEYGLPLVVHHGTDAQFEVFSKELLGSNTGAASAEMGFFFAETEETAQSYIQQKDPFQTYARISVLESQTAVVISQYTDYQFAQFCQQYNERYKQAREAFDYYMPGDWDIAEEGLREYNYYSELLNSETNPDNIDMLKWNREWLMKDMARKYDGMGIALEHRNDPPMSRVMDLYLSIQNPYVFDYEGQDRFSKGVSYAEIIAKAKAEGYDGVILKNTYDGAGMDNIYVVFEPEQIKSIENDGTFNKLDPNILHQDAKELVKGTFEHGDFGNLIRMLQASDVSTMVHETGHMFRQTLSTPLLTEFTKWAGFESVEEFQELEVKFWRNDETLTQEQRNRYEEAEEKFARGFEQYLMDGSAPTPGLKAVFKSFRDYLLDIYQSVKRTVTGNDYSGQGEFVFHGKTGDEVLNINAEINGVRLRDIFDRMLTDDVQRMPGYQTLVQELRTKLSQDRHNMRMSDKALSRRAQVEVTKQILQHFGSMDEAEQALAAYDLPLDIDGMRVDDGTLFEAIQAAKADPQMNPFASAERHEVKGSNSYAYSITEANSGKKYQLQYKVMELADLEPSNVWFGDQLIINENYPADLQGRNRAADHSDVYAHAANLNAGLLIDEQHAIDSGAPIVGEGNAFVESGNGRVLSLRYAQEHFPDQWDAYQEYLRDSVDQYGIDPASLDSFENPVLVRERLGGDAVSFAEDANTNRNKAMTASENALTDANKVNMTTLSLLDIQPGEGIETFTTEKNAQPSVEWLRSLPESERNKYSTINRNGDLVLSTEGTARFTNALFATLYATPESMEIIRSFAELADSNIQAVESALKATLPEMARAEGLIKTGSRAENLSITGDIMAAAGLLLEARKAGINIHDYLAQSTIPGLERWTPTQALLAGFFGDAKNNVRMIKDFINAYGEEVYKAADPNQMSFGFEEPKTREQMINDSLTAALQAKQDRAEGKRQQSAASSQQPAVEGPAAAVQYGPWVEDPVTKRKRRAVTHPDGSVTYQSVGADVDVSEDTPALKQSSVMDSDGKWSGEFAKVLDENKQRTFDDGMSMPLDQAAEVYLTGEQNVKYETMVQRWLRDFTNSRNLTADQYLYAWDYLEWWVQGSEGEAPKGNPIWEEKIRKMVMQDFTGEHGDLVSELQRRYKRGAEVDPTAVPNKGEFFKRTYGFEHGFWNIAGNVYKDGKLVAWLPEELDRMQKTIEVDGQSYKVLGVDMRNPEGLVYYDPLLEIVRTVNVGKPEGFEEPRNPFAFMRPARQGSTPQTMPAADGYSEIAKKYLFPALDKFGEEYEKADTDARTKQMSGLDLETRAQIEQWLDQDVSEDMRMEKYRAMKYSDMKRDAAMLNYNQRYGFDPILTMLSPYQFWYTRSMWKWAKRMIDKPALGNAYERLKEYEDKNRQENIPSRMAGRWRIPMPFLPDWMGGSYYVDLNSALFPFSQFGESYSSNMNTATLNARAEAILNDLTDAGQITAAEMQNALSTKKGAIWENAYAQAETEVGRNDQLNTLASQFISPNIFTSWYKKKQAGEDPGMLSGTRTGNAIKALTSDIPLVSQIGSVIGDAMTLPEKALRKLYGFDYNEFGALGDQYIRKQISQMCADGDITWRQALNAMNEKSGTIWEMAADRQRKEAMMKVPGFAGAEAAKQFAMGNANIGDALGAIGISLLGGGQIYPTGEQELRAEKASRDEAYIRKAAGDSQAVSQWYRDNPNYVTRQATYIQDPEKLLKFTLYQNITSQYYAQPYAQQQEILNELGPEFDYAVMNSETRNYKAVPIEKLAEWNARIGGSTPNVGNIDVQGVERVLQLNEPVIDAVAEHDEIKRTMFPGISVIQNGYYALPKSQRKAYLESFPQLSAYWTWNRQYKDEHPEYVRWENERTAYYNEETLYNSYADMSERTQQELEYAKATGNEMSQAAQYELQRLYQKYANSNYMSWQEYIRQLQNWD